MIYPILLTWKPVAVKNAVCGPFADMFAYIYGVCAKIEYYVSNKSLFRVKNIQNRLSVMVPCRGEGGKAGGRFNLQKAEWKGKRICYTIKERGRFSPQTAG